jgi:hypothetical protein
MAENKGNGSNEGQIYNLDTIGLEIDNEIESLFVPASEKSASASPSLTIDKQMDTPFVPADQKPPAKLRMEEVSEITVPIPDLSGSDPLDSAELAIDREIDTLFVPAEQRPPAILQMEEASEKAAPIPDLSGSDPLDSAELAIDREIDTLFVPADQRPPAKLEAEEASEQAAPIPDLAAASPPSLTTAEFEIDREIDTLFVPADQRPPVKLEAEEATQIAAPIPDHAAASSPSLTTAEFEIDREIDTLFVPANQKFPEISPEPKPAAVSAPLSEAPSAGKFDLDNFESQIDQEIDTMFVPGGAILNVCPEPPVTPKVHSDFTATDGPQHQADLHIPTLAPAPAPSPKPDTEEFAPKSAGLPPLTPSRAHLNRLIESFNAAYLSLDWEFSSENVRNLQSALSDLEPYSDRPHGSSPIFKILRAILSRLAVKPQSVNTELIEMIRDCQGLLAHVMLMETSMGPMEKERIKAIISRFRTLRERALAARDARFHEKQSALAESAQAEIQVMEDVILDEKMPDRWSLRELKAWMESAGQSIQEILIGMDGEIKRIRQIEQALVKAKALTQVLAKLTDIRSGLEGRLHVLKEKQGEWSEKATWVEHMERVSIESEGLLQKSVEMIGDQPQVLTAEIPEEQPATPRRSLCLFHFAGKLFALPSSSVMKTQPVNQKKTSGILKRGLANLEDFRLLFRSIKTGVLGEWAKVPGKTLKSFRFIPIAPPSYAISDIPSTQHTAIFLSNGNGHGIIFADPVKIEFESLPDAASTDPCPPSQMTTFTTESGECAEVLNPDNILPHSDSTNPAR